MTYAAQPPPSFISRALESALSQKFSHGVKIRLSGLFDAMSVALPLPRKSFGSSMRPEREHNLQNWLQNFSSKSANYWTTVQ